MDPISSFRGFAGEVLRSYTRPTLFLTVFPMLVVWLIFVVYMAIVGHKIPMLINMAIIYCLFAMFIGRYAIPASRGDLTTGIFSAHIARGETLSFVARYVIISLIWGIPLVLIIWGVTGQIQNTLMTNFMHGPVIPGFSGQVGFQSVVLFICLILLLIMPLFTAILAAATQDITDVIQPGFWGWLFSERRADILPFLAAMAGGIAMFWLIYIIPFVLITYVAFKTSSNAGAAVATFFSFLPFLAAPVLIGRLAGAFIAGETEMDVDTDPNAQAFKQEVYADSDVANAIAQNIAEQTGTTPPAQASQNAPSTEIVIMSFHDIVSNVRNLSDKELTKAIITAEQALEANPFDVNRAVELIYLKKRMEQEDASLSYAGKAITLGVERNAHNLVLDVYRAFVKERTKLDLDEKALRGLSQLLIDKQHYLDAAWCLYYTIKVSGADPIAIQKRILGVADEALKEKKYDDAIALYQFFVKKFPGSDLEGYAKEQMEVAKRRKS